MEGRCGVLVVDPNMDLQEAYKKAVLVVNV